MNEKKQFLMKQKKNLDKGKRGILNIVFGRTGILIMLVVLQIGILLAGFRFIRDYIFAAYGASMLLGVCLSIYLVNRRGNPAFTMAWMVPILTVPVFGSLFYLYFTLQMGPRFLNKKLIAENAVTSQLVNQKQDTLEQLKNESLEMANLASYLRKTSGSAVHQHTNAKYFSSGEAAFDVIMNEMKAAKKYIFVEFFILNQGYMLDSVLEVLKAKVQEGVDVRVLYDGMCDYFTLPKNYPKRLEEYGIKCLVFSPIVPLLSTVQNNRDHRKILVIDGHTAFTGGINLADEYINEKERFGYWKDSCIMLKGSAVQEFTLMFLQMWNVVEDAKVNRHQNRPARVPNLEEYRSFIEISPEEKEKIGSGYVIAYDDNPLDGEQVGEYVYMDILYTAKKYVHIMTPYLVLDHEMLVALEYAAKRGIDVKIIMPHIPDKKYAFLLARTYYNELLDAGVEIYEFLPGFVHSKIFVSDDEKAVVGSINLDFRSLYLSFECAALLYKNSEVSAVEQDFQHVLQYCEKVTQDVYNNQPRIKKAAGQILRIFAPLM